ncbi:MAG: response regulator transcription factor [Spirochaetaceae bacterium]|nr:response regulator transcription factor [Spirochaetaceae bacterium]
MAGELGIFIVDDHPVVRVGLRYAIESSERYFVAGEASSVEDAESRIASLAEPPAAAVVDLSLPGRSGIDLVRALSRKQPGLRFVVFSISADAERIAEAFRAGASAFVSKESPASRVLDALEAVFRGEVFLDSPCAGTVVSALAGGAPVEAADGPRRRYDSLTSREKDVAVLIAGNMKIAAVAAELGISVKTVENHRASVFAKLGVGDRLELYRCCRELGLVD